MEGHVIVQMVNKPPAAVEKASARRIHVSQVLDPFQFAAMFIGGLAIGFYNGWWELTLVSLCSAPVLAVSATIFGKFLKKDDSTLRNAFAAARSVSEEFSCSVCNPNSENAVITRPRSQQVLLQIRISRSSGNSKRFGHQLELCGGQCS